MDKERLAEKRELLHSHRNHAEFVALNKIITELWFDRTGEARFSSTDDISRSFSKDTVKMFKKVFSALDIDMEQYAEKRGNRKEYNIPAVAAEFFYVIASMDGKKGSMRSKILTNKLDDITYEEEIQFINAVVDRLEKRFSTDDKILRDLEEYRCQCKLSAELIKEIHLLKKDVSEHLVKSISESFEKFGVFRYTDIIMPSMHYKQLNLIEEKGWDAIEMPDEEELHKPIPPMFHLNDTEKLFILAQQKDFLLSGITCWERAVNNYLAMRWDNTQYDVRSTDNIKEDWQKSINDLSTRSSIKEDPAQLAVLEEFLKSLHRKKL